MYIDSVDVYVKSFSNSFIDSPGQSGSEAKVLRPSLVQDLLGQSEAS